MDPLGWAPPLVVCGPAQRFPFCLGCSKKDSSIGCPWFPGHASENVTAVVCGYMSRTDSLHSNGFPASFLAVTEDSLILVPTPECGVSLVVQREELGSKHGRHDKTSVCLAARFG